MFIRLLSIFVFSIGGFVVGAATAQTSSPTGPTLQDRVEALAQQIGFRYRYRESARLAHRDQVERVLSDWNRLADGEANRENRALMADWLDRALRAEMPGGSGDLPASPQFSSEPTAPTPIEPEPETIEAETNPIDDPQTEPRGEVTEPSPKPSSPAAAEETTLQPRPARRTMAKPVSPEPEQREPAGPARSKWSRHPAAAPLEWRDPFETDSAASPDPLRSGTRYETQRPTFEDHSAVRIDRRQLEAQVRGYNAALRELQLRVMNLGADDLQGLADATDELNRLDQKRQFLDLYRDGLPPAEQSRLPASPSAELIRELVRRKASDLAEQSPPMRASQHRAWEQIKARLAGLEAEAQASR